MDGLWTSINEALKKRTTSATLGTYLFFWAAYHWQGLYATFFVDQQLILKKYGLLKNEYVFKYFFGYHGLLDWQFIFGLIVPAILTCLFILIVPRKLFVHFYKQEQGYRIDKRLIKIKEEERVAERQERLATQVEKTVQAEIKATDKKREAAQKDPTILWNEEYETVKVKNANDLRGILESVYKHGGQILVESDSAFASPEFELDPNSLRFGDAREIINIVQSGSRIELTKKGKYFASKFEGRI